MDQPLFSENLARVWPSFVDCETRLRTMLPFLEKVINGRGAGRVLDWAAGMGCEAVGLALSGYDVIGNEVDPVLLDMGKARAERAGSVIKWTEVDWRNASARIDGRDVASMLLLGNSLCLLLDRQDRCKAAAEIAQVARPGTRLVVDERNFRYMLLERRKILQGDFRYGGRVVYCGHEIIGRPIAISRETVVFGYFWAGSEDLIGALTMWPFAKGELTRLFSELGFRLVSIYSDLLEGERGDADFYTYVFEKAGE